MRYIPMHEAFCTSRFSSHPARAWPLPKWLSECQLTEGKYAVHAFGKDALGQVAESSPAICQAGSW